ncbi:unnamed protein product [Linum trigynum]|uniref:Uncharacterized protein n=1 Tax=Linum trigynum TaxID=586398 RepID=A0AAV2GIX6_9ROSI
MGPGPPSVTSFEGELDPLVAEWAASEEDLATVFDVYNSPMKGTPLVSDEPMLPSLAASQSPHHDFPPPVLDPVSTPPPPPVLRRSDRDRRLPAKLAIYYVELPSSSSSPALTHPISNHVSYHRCSYSHCAFSAAI